MRKIMSVHDLRGIAAFGVLLYHSAGFVAGYGSHAISPDPFRIGEAGVDIFFVISGFILTLVTQSARSAPEFMAGRLARVGIPYWCIILALAGMTLVAPSAFRSFTWHGSDLVLSLAFVPSIIRDGSIFPLLEPGWTLSLEMLFYLLLALTLWASPRRRAVLVSIALCCLVVAGGLLHLPQGESIAWFFTQPILVEFCFGIVLARIYLSEWQPSPAVAASLALLGIAGFVIAAVHPPASFEALRTLLFGPPAACLVAGAVLLEKSGIRLKSKLLSFLGTISYSLYLTHVLVLAVVAKLLSRHVHGVGGDLAMMLVAILSAILAASVYYRLVERPALKLAHHLQARMREARPGTAALPKAEATG